MSPPHDTPCSPDLRHDVAAAAVASSDPKSHSGSSGGGDDMPAQPPSVPNNPIPAETTYCVLSLSVHELDNGGGGRDDHADQAPKKRPATSGRCSDDSSPPSHLPKKRKMVDCVGSFGSNAGGNRKTVAVPRPGGGAPAGSTAVDTALAKELHRRAIKLGKQKVTVEREALTAATPEPPKEKLMQDGIRAAAAPRLPPERTMHVPPPPAAMMDGQLHNDIDMSAELRERLEELGATPPVYVCKKALKRSDVDLNQNRLLISCKSDLPKCPITHIFTGEEREIVHEDDNESKEKKKKTEEKPGLKVTMLDHGGDRYATTCRYLTSNGGYRFIGEWGKFLRSNGLAVSRGEEWTRNVRVRLLEFRSRRLPRAEQSGHPDGALGFVVLHDENYGYHSDSGDDEVEWKGKAPPPTNAKKKKNSNEHVKATSSAAAVASSSAAAAPKREVTAALVTRSVELETDDERMRAAVNGILKLGNPRSSSEYDGSKPSSDKEEKKADANAEGLLS